MPGGIGVARWERFAPAFHHKRGLVFTGLVERVWSSEVLLLSIHHFQIMSFKSFALVSAAGLMVATAATSVVTPPAQAASKWEYKQRVRQQNREIRHLRRQNRALRWERTVPVYRGRYLPAVRDYALPVYHRRYVPHYRLIDHDVRPIRPRAGFSLFGGSRGGPRLYLDLN